MKFISTAVHGMLDYTVAIFLMVLPWLVDFNGPQLWIPMGLGIATLLYSLATDYERGAWPLIPMRIHLVLDLASGLLLAFSPWIFHFEEVIRIPYVVAGLVVILVVLFSRTRPSRNANLHPVK